MEVNNLETNRRAQIGNITIPLLKGEQGKQGEQGYSISRVERTSGDGTPGTTDTYTIYINTTPETAIGTFQVVNGQKGETGETGLTPNIQIGTVTQGSSFNVTRTGTNENPILDFTLVKGDKGEQRTKAEILEVLERQEME